MRRTLIGTVSLAVFCMLLTALPACSTAPTTEQGRADIKTQAASTLQSAKAKDATLEKTLNNAAGYAVFPSVGKGGAGVGGAYGRGVVYQDGKAIGFCDLSQATIGLQLGGQAYSEILVFATQDALDRFKQGNFAFSAQATAVALQSGAAANAKFSEGVAVFTMGQSGLMYEASIGGQKFSFERMGQA